MRYTNTSERTKPKRGKKTSQGSGRGTKKSKKSYKGQGGRKR